MTLREPGTALKGLLAVAACLAFQSVSGAEESAADSRFAEAVDVSARRGADWLMRMQRPDGLFLYGWIPALNQPMEGNNHLRQAGAAAALARSAAYTGDPESSSAARQAIRVLLQSYTEVDPQDDRVRLPNAPVAEANPVGLAALLLLAVSELPEPTDVLAEQGEQLARFLVARQRADGSINVASTLFIDDDPEDDPIEIAFYPGEALYALMRSHAVRPRDWKLEAVRRAFPFYAAHWRENPDPVFIPWQSAAYAEAYLATSDRQYAGFVFEMNDWLLQFQYADSQTPADWDGGFASLYEGHVVRTPPTAATGSYAESLVEACRAAKAVWRECQDRAGGDAGVRCEAAKRRFLSYRQATERSIGYLMRTQYEKDGFDHFTPAYREKLDGAIHGGISDGDVRIDFVQHAIFAMFHYLTYVADSEPALPTSSNQGRKDAP